MTRRSRILASVEVRTLAPDGVFASANANPLMLVALTGPLEVMSSDGEHSSLQRRDVLGSEGDATLEIRGPGTVAVVRMTQHPSTTPKAAKIDDVR